MGWQDALAGFGAGAQNFASGLLYRNDQLARQRERDEQLEMERQRLAAQQRREEAAAAEKQREQDRQDLEVMRGIFGAGNPLAPDDAAQADALAAGAGLPFMLGNAPRRFGGMDMPEGVSTVGAAPGLSGYGGRRVTGASADPSAGRIFLPTAAERQAKTAAQQQTQAEAVRRSSLDSFLKRAPSTVQQAAAFGDITGKMPTLQPGDFEDPAVEAQRGIDTEVKKQTALFPLKMKEAAGRASIEAKYRPAPIGQPDDAKQIAQAIISGTQPPDLSRLYGAGSHVRAELARNGYDLVKATEDWQATQKYLQTLNGAQQVRLRQAVDFTAESLGTVEALAKQWKSAGLGPLSRAALVAAQQGAMGQDAQSLATRLDAQIADVVSELATVYKGGNASTDESLKLAAKNLQADWSEKALIDNLSQIRTNLGYRRNSMRSAGVAGMSPDNRYAPGGRGENATPPPQRGAAAQPGEERVINGQRARWDGRGWIAVSK